MSLEYFFCGPQILMKVVPAGDSGVFFSVGENWEHVQQVQPKSGRGVHRPVLIEIDQEGWCADKAPKKNPRMESCYIRLFFLNFFEKTASHQSNADTSLSSRQGGGRVGPIAVMIQVDY
jgi:hypothetical protein